MVLYICKNHCCDFDSFFERERSTPMDFSQAKFILAAYSLLLLLCLLVCGLYKLLIYFDDTYIHLLYLIGNFNVLHFKFI